MTELSLHGRDLAKQGATLLKNRIRSLTPEEHIFYARLLHTIIEHEGDLSLVPDAIHSIRHAEALGHNGPQHVLARLLVLESQRTGDPAHSVAAIEILEHAVDSHEMPTTYRDAETRLTHFALIDAHVTAGRLGQSRAQFESALRRAQQLVELLPEFSYVTEYWSDTMLAYAGFLADPDVENLTKDRFCEVLQHVCFGSHYVRYTQLREAAARSGFSGKVTRRYVRELIREGHLIEPRPGILMLVPPADWVREDDTGDPEPDPNHPTRIRGVE